MPSPDQSGRTVCIGLISGTSADGIDAVLASFADGSDAAPEIMAATTVAYPQSIRASLQPLLDSGQVASLAALGELDSAIGDCFAAAASQVCEQAGIAMHTIHAIGSHGQTVAHDADSAQPYSLQLGDPNRIALRCQIPVVADFRRMDLAAGGHAAPLAPLLHAQLFRRHDEDVAVVNIGGIANISLLPADPGQAVTGYDSGPGNCLLDNWYRSHRAGDFDRDGQWAASGNVNQALLKDLLAEPWLNRPAPKSTGREHFSLDWLQQRHAGVRRLPAEDVQATLLQFTARSIVNALPGKGRIRELIVCGGGAHNQTLLDALARLLPNGRVSASDDHGHAADHIEGLLFAWLAWQRMQNRPIDTGSITGATQPLLLGNLFRAS